VSAPVTKKLCQFNGGSHLYHLNTPASDIDERGVFMHTEARFILGTDRFEEIRKQNPAIQEDVVYKELNAWVTLLRKGNTEALEILFAPEADFVILTNEMRLFRESARDFLDSTNLYNCLRGYAQGEYRLAMGERTGVLGSKRKAALDKHGFSPKNATQLMRLLLTGIFLFENDTYVTDCRFFGSDLFKYLFEIKTKPESYSAELLTKDYKELDARLTRAFEARKVTYTFNTQLANQLLLDCYYPHIQVAWQQPVYDALWAKLRKANEKQTT
jgi:hypothetical protein